MRLFFKNLARKNNEKFKGMYNFQFVEIINN